MRWLLFLFALYLAACGGGDRDSPPSTATIHAVTTVPAPAMWLRALGGEHIQVEVLLPPGASPHVWQPSIASMRALSDADLRVIVGGGFEPWAEQFLNASRTTQRQANFDMMDALVGRLASSFPEDFQAAQFLTSTQRVIPDEFDRDAALDYSSNGSSESENTAPLLINPHIWLSPTLARAICADLKQQLIALDPVHREEYTRLGDAYCVRIATLQELCSAHSRVWFHKRIITFHAAWGHFAHETGLTVAGIIERSPGVEPSPHEMRDLTDRIRAEHVDAIIAEPQFNDATARRLSEATNVPLVVLEPYGRENQTYDELILSNLHELEKVLGTP